MKLLRIFITVIGIVGLLTTAQATIVQHVVLQAPTNAQKIYLYFDVHLPLATFNQQQLDFVREIRKKNPCAKIIAECCQGFLKKNTGKDASIRHQLAKQALPPCNFPQKTKDNIRDHFANFNRAPGNLNDHFLNLLANTKTTDNLCIEFADDNRFTINRGINYLWTMGWLVPMVQLTGADTTTLEEDMMQHNPDSMKLDTLLSNILQALKLFATQLKNLQKTDSKNSDLAKKVKQVDTIVQDFTKISQQVKKFAGNAATLGEFRKKSKEHAQQLVTTLGATKEVPNQQLKDVLSLLFDEFFHPAVAAYIYEAHNALDTALLDSILSNKTSSPIVAYVGGAHGRVLEKELERRGYTVLEHSPVRVQKKNTIEEFPSFDHYIQSLGKSISYSPEDIALIGNQLAGPTKAAMLAPSHKS